MLDESLAKGLKNSLWRSAITETKRIKSIGRLNLLPKNYATRKGVRKGIDLAEKQYESKLRLVSGRSEGRKPFWWSIQLTMNDNLAINEWQENVFGAYFAGQRFFPNLSKHCDLRIRIGEHAVTRLYQRAPYDIGLPLLDSIYPELACACMHGFWHFNVLGALLDTTGHTYRAFVPTATGAFLGEISKTGEYLDLRTYIAEEQMRPEQVRLWTELRNLNIEEVALQIFPMFMLNMGANSKKSTTDLLQSLVKVIIGFPRLLGPKHNDDAGSND